MFIIQQLYVNIIIEHAAIAARLLHTSTQVLSGECIYTSVISTQLVVWSFYTDSNQNPISCDHV